MPRRHDRARHSPCERARGEAPLHRRTTVLRSILTSLSQDARCRVAEAARASSADPDLLVDHEAVDLSLIIRVLTPSEWTAAMQRLGGPTSGRLVS